MAKKIKTSKPKKSRPMNGLQRKAHLQMVRSTYNLFR